MARSSGEALGLGQLGYATGHNANSTTSTSMTIVKVKAMLTLTRKIKGNERKCPDTDCTL